LGQRPDLYKFRELHSRSYLNNVMLLIRTHRQDLPDLLESSQIPKDDWIRGLIERIASGKIKWNYQ
ncbi:MAG: hypothetical protein AAGI38_23265, partial [Bacteroidota bacterium]